MKKSQIIGFIIIAVGVAIVIGFFASLDDQSESRAERVFHITLADPELYENGKYSEIFEIDQGIYEFRFVPNGDSPQILSITLNGKSFSFDGDFELEGTPHESGISSFFTWKYLGKKMIEIPESQKVEIVINPNGNLLGPLTVDIVHGN